NKIIYCQPNTRYYVHFDRDSSRIYTTTFYQNPSILIRCTKTNLIEPSTNEIPEIISKRNENRNDQTKFKFGQTVFERYDRSKSHDKYSGPYVILKVNDDHTCEVMSPEFQMKRVHMDNLKCTSVPELPTHSRSSSPNSIDQ
ncbi:hypothetical protein BDFB_004160, partial [Asbolus verrucosus]